MPSLACASGVARVTSTSLNRMLPPVGVRSPATQLKNVDLPAPFGPISPTISPSVTSRLAPESASSAPKLRETFCALRSMRFCRCNVGAMSTARHHAMPQIEQPARLVPRQQNNNTAVDNVSEARSSPAIERIGHSLQWHQDHCADQWPEQTAGAAERGDDNEFNRLQNAKSTFRIDEADHQRIERTGDRREARAEQQRIKFVAHDGNAQAARRALAGTNGAPVIAHAAPLQMPGQQQQTRQHREKNVVIRNRTAKRQIEPRTRHR